MECHKARHLSLRDVTIGLVSVYSFKVLKEKNERNKGKYYLQQYHLVSNQRENTNNLFVFNFDTYDTLSYY